MSAAVNGAPFPFRSSAPWQRGLSPVVVQLLQKITDLSPRRRTAALADLAEFLKISRAEMRRLAALEEDYFIRQLLATPPLPRLDQADSDEI